MSPKVTPTAVKKKSSLSLVGGSGVIDNFSFGRKEKERYQDYCYLKTKTDRYKNHVVVIEGSEIYWYKTLGDIEPQIMHSLVRTFAKLMPEEVVPELASITLWPVKIILPPNKSRIIYFESQEQ